MVGWRRITPDSQTVEKELSKGLKQTRVLATSDDGGVVEQTKHHPEQGGNTGSTRVIISIGQ
jgi:hypothetical protein